MELLQIRPKADGSNGSVLEGIINSLKETWEDYEGRNEGIDESGLNDRVNQLYDFIVKWTKPDDLLAVAMERRCTVLLKLLLEHPIADNPGEFSSHLLETCLSVYAIAEARMQADLEKREKEVSEKRKP